MKIIKLKNYITVILNDGVILNSSECTEEMYLSILDNPDDENFVRCLLIPEFCKKQEEIKAQTQLLDSFNSSEYLTVFGSSIYLKEISEVTLPEDLAVAFIKAEKENNQELIQTYLNFWTLCSLNPDSRARTNLFWFLNRYGMKISKSGLFVAYRNVNLKKDGSEISNELAAFVGKEYAKIKYKHKKSPKNYNVYQKVSKKDNLKNEFEISKVNENVSFENSAFLGSLQELYTKLSNKELSPVYTDAHSGKFTIKIGEPVFMERSKCDSNSDVTCSSGLHLAGKSWLEQDYFGSISLLCLVNPADVVAIPKEDSYGKIRVCQYYPVQIIERDEHGDIIDEDFEDGFEDDFINYIVYEGDVNNVDNLSYTFKLPNLPEINRELIIRRLSEISKSLKKYVN